MFGSSKQLVNCLRLKPECMVNLVRQATTSNSDSGNASDLPVKKVVKLPEEIKQNHLPILYPKQMDWLDERQVRISKPSKNVMQSGTANTKTWKIEFNSEQRWENWLMGWTSTADPVSNLTMNFPTKEDAIAFCERNKLYWFVEEQPERKIRRKSYADNFSWNKRTRLGSK